MIEVSGISEKVADLFEQGEKEGKNHVDLSLEALRMETDAVHYYLEQFTELTPVANNWELMYYVTALMLYSEYTWKAVERFSDSLKDFYDIIKDVLAISTATASIDIDKAEAELRGLKDEQE